MKWETSNEFNKVGLQKGRSVRRLKQNCNWGSCFMWLLPFLIGKWGFSWCVCTIASAHDTLWFCQELYQAVSKLPLLESFPSRIKHGSTVVWVLVEKGMSICALFVFIPIPKLWHQNIILGKRIHVWFLLFTETGSKVKHLLLHSTEKIML